DYYDDDFYYYSSRIKRFHSSASHFGYYDPFFIDPFYYGGGLWTPGLSIYISSYPSYGFRYNPWRPYYRPLGYGFYDPFYRPYYGFYDPFYRPYYGYGYGYGYGGYGYSPYYYGGYTSY